MLLVRFSMVLHNQQQTMEWHWEVLHFNLFNVFSSLFTHFATERFIFLLKHAKMKNNK